MPANPIIQRGKALTVYNKIRRSLGIYEVSIFKFPRHLVTKAWDKACKFWSIFGFSLPRVNRSILDTKEPQGSAIAFMNFAEKKVTANLHRLDLLGILHRLDSVFIHELGHKTCPGDLKTLLLLNSAVKQVFEDDYSAGMVRNLFSDMLVNVDSHRRGDRGIHEVYSILWANTPDKIQQIIGRAYEKLFQRQDTSRAYRQTIIRTPVAPEIEGAADKISYIILNARRSNWLKSAREFAKVLKEHVPEIPMGVTYVISDVKPSDFSREGKTPIPPKGKSDKKELEKRLGGVVYELRQLEEEGDKKPCSPDVFRKFLEDSKINVTDNEALIWYYRDLVSGKVVKVPEVSVASGALFPFSPKTWRPGDPIHKLDPVLSKSVGGVMIPGVTTKQWEMRRGQHLKVGKDYPSLDLWIDCSPSMPDPAKTISHAAAAGMIVSKSFLATRKSVRVVTWSGTMGGRPQFVSTNGFVRDEDEIDRKIVSYFGEWTILPLAEFEKPYLKKGKEKYIVMITDLVIGNLTQDTIDRLKNVFDQSVGGTIFLIMEDRPGKTEEEKEEEERLQKIFRDIGFDVVPVKKVADLNKHALKLTKQLFEERLVM